VGAKPVVSLRSTTGYGAGKPPACGEQEEGRFGMGREGTRVPTLERKAPSVLRSAVGGRGLARKAVREMKFRGEQEALPSIHV